MPRPARKNKQKRPPRLKLLRYNPAGYRDVPKTLRAVARSIKRGKYGIVKHAVLVIDVDINCDQEADDAPGPVSIHSMGDRTAYDWRSDIALLHIGICYLSAMALDPDGRGMPNEDPTDEGV